MLAWIWILVQTRVERRGVVESKRVQEPGFRHEDVQRGVGCVGSVVRVEVSGHEDVSSLRTLLVTTDATGDASFTFANIDPPIPAGRSVTATATNQGGSTSEFSAAEVVPSGCRGRQVAGVC